jgi:hypothetical protein
MAFHRRPNKIIDVPSSRSRAGSRSRTPREILNHIINHLQVMILVRPQDLAIVCDVVDGLLRDRSHEPENGDGDR